MSLPVRALIAGLFAAATLTGTAAEAKIKKVLPFFLDQKGRISVSPDLFARDAYQQKLRDKPATISAVRYDVQWSSHGVDHDRLKIRLQLRTAKRDASAPLVIEAAVKDNRRIGGWSSVRLDAETYREAGEVLSWRAVLLDGDQEIAEQKSFLW